MMISSTTTLPINCEDMNLNCLKIPQDEVIRMSDDDSLKDLTTHMLIALISNPQFDGVYADIEFRTLDVWYKRGFDMIYIDRNDGFAINFKPYYSQDRPGADYFVPKAPDLNHNGFYNTSSMLPFFGERYQLFPRNVLSDNQYIKGRIYFLDNKWRDLLSDLTFFDTTTGPSSTVTSNIGPPLAPPTIPNEPTLEDSKLELIHDSRLSQGQDLPPAPTSPPASEPTLTSKLEAGFVNPNNGWCVVS
jgi:hypothetical protein